MMAERQRIHLSALYKTQRTLPRKGQSIDPNGLFSSNGALFRCDMDGTGIEGHMAISTSGLTPPMRRQWEAQQQTARDERAKLTNPKTLAEKGVVRWNRSPHYEDQLTNAAPPHGRTARTARTAARQNAIWLNSPYALGPQSYGRKK